MADIIDQGGWGVCGFVSVLNAMRDAGKLTKISPRGSGPEPVSLDMIRVRIYATLTTYLNALSKDPSKKAIAAEIEDLSKILRPSGEPVRTLPSIVEDIEDALRTKVAKVSEDELDKKIAGIIHDKAVFKNLTVAMSEAAVVDFLAWIAPTTPVRRRQVAAKDDIRLVDCRNCIVGLGAARQDLIKYNGLMHWIYIDKDLQMNNWGAKTHVTKETTPGSLHPELKVVTDVLALD